MIRGSRHRRPRLIKADVGHDGKTDMASGWTTSGGSRVIIRTRGKTRAKRKTARSITYSINAGNELAACLNSASPLPLIPGWPPSPVRCSLAENNRRRIKRRRCQQIMGQRAPVSWAAWEEKRRGFACLLFRLLYFFFPFFFLFFFFGGGVFIFSAFPFFP